VFKKQLPALAEAGHSVVALVGRDYDGRNVPGVRMVKHGWRTDLIGRFFALPSVLMAALRCKAKVYLIGNYELVFLAPILRAFTGAAVVYDAMEHWPDMIRQSPFVPRVLRRGVAACADMAERPFAVWCHTVLTADEGTAARYAWHALFTTFLQ
jgi:hypothetical protein